MKLQNINVSSLKISNTILNLILLFINYSCIYNFVLSLKGCKLRLQKCIISINTTYYIKLFYLCLKSSILAGIGITLAVKKIKKRYIHLFNIISFFSLLYKRNFGKEFSNHGYYNFLCLFLVLSAFALIYFCFHEILRLKKKIYNIHIFNINSTYYHFLY